MRGSDGRHIVFNSSRRLLHMLRGSGRSWLQQQRCAGGVHRLRYMSRKEDMMLSGMIGLLQAFIYFNPYSFTLNGFLDGTLFFVFFVSQIVTLRISNRLACFYLTHSSLTCVTGSLGEALCETKYLSFLSRTSGGH